ncbi:MAG TPA: GMC family oxidoreductase [Candidatus Hydrogenedens sp.]|nr:GMC family oxidoreductase [Candidatus Hydrogenedens sp.]HOL20539.1 GMC family oxidoreductase [Candidatus Hydrogenedens sp.]HPP60055.1 GMC family oxidoreductase [Candidatus Hydrogenedens sp.]
MNEELIEIYRKNNVVDVSKNMESDYLKQIYDFIVIGSGAGGAVVAKELTEYGANVALIEEGSLPFPWEKSAFRSLLKLYRDKGFTGVIGKPMIPIPLGRCVGGTTVINSGTCFRVPQKILHQWEIELELKELTSTDLSECYEKVEREIHVEKANWDVMNKSNLFIRKIMNNKDIPCYPLKRNTKDCEGCGMCCYGCTSGAKKSMELTYIPKGIQSGMVLFYNARVNRILTHNGKIGYAVLIDIIDPETQKVIDTIELKGEKIIVACGTLLSPSLLKRSGIALNNPNLGRHLTIHPASKISIELNDEINSWMGIPQGCYTDALEEEGIIFEGVAMPPDLGPSAVPYTGEELKYYWQNYKNIATFGFMIKDSTEGYLKYSIKNQPVYSYQLTSTDVTRLKRAICFLAELALEEKPKQLFLMISKKPNIIKTKDDLHTFLKVEHLPSDFECMAFHPLGTCRTAHSPEHGVCDQNFKVFNTDNIYICDGSIIPTSLGVNPQLTIMAFATQLGKNLGMGKV